MSQRGNKDCIIRAYEKLIKNDHDLFYLDANERSITHKLAEYLQKEYPDLNVDCEYNRKGAIPKKLTTTVKAIKSDNIDGVTVYPDIIVHHRNTDDNFIVIEAKKSNNLSQNEDVDKLKAYKREFGYKYAFAIMFPVDKDLTEVDLDELISEVSL